MCNLKAAQNIQSILIQELVLNEFKQGHNATEATRNICFAKGESTVGHSNQRVQEILLRLQKPWPSGKTKLVKNGEFQDYWGKSNE